jgi:hypothetical protein
MIARTPALALVAVAAMAIIPVAVLAGAKPEAAQSDTDARSAALFVEMGKVIQSPRCQNCHPVGQRPTQADDMHPHLPLVVRGADDQGAIAMRCATCHHAANFQPAGVPGAPKWHVAPVDMAWQGKSLGQICEQIKDPARNGKRTLAQLHEHMAFDPLVGWGWHPGGTRTPAPGTQKQFGDLVQAWIVSGAACPAA